MRTTWNKRLNAVDHTRASSGLRRLAAGGRIRNARSSVTITDQFGKRRASCARRRASHAVEEFIVARHGAAPRLADDIAGRLGNTDKKQLGQCIRQGKLGLL